MTCEQRRDLLLLYVADALEADATIEMRRHLMEGCAECAGYLAEAQAVMSSIPLGLDPVTPPPQLKEKLMQRIAAAESAATGSRDDDDTGYPAPLRIFKYLIPTALAAGIAIVCTHSVMMQRVNELQQEQHASVVENAQRLNQLRGQYQSQTQVVEMLQSPGLKLIPLKATEHQPGAVATLLWDQKKNQWAILTTGMKPAAAGQTYELWFITEAGAKIAAGTFDVDANGTGSLKVPIPANIGELKLAAVTNEKAGGATQPAGDIQVAGNVD